MAAIAMGTGLWSLPAQPTPQSDVTGSTFVTIWAFVCTGFVVLFSAKLRAPNPTWSAFKNIRNPTVLLAVWYTAAAADRWMHYEEHAVPYGYILFDSLNQVLQIVSTIWFLWGTYDVIWNELERRFRRKVSQGAFWLAAKVVIFIVGLVSFFYVLLNIASRVVWVEFLSLNIIADVATKRNNFEIAMTVFFSVFGLLTIIAAVATLVYRANKTTGTWAKTRIYLLVATVMLFARSLTECALAFLAQTPEIPRPDVQLAYDIAYGTLTSLYLAFMYLQALQVSRKNDKGSAEVENVESDVRAHILDKLRNITEHKLLEAPPFKIILDQTKNEVPTILETSLLSVNSNMTPEKKRQVAEDYIKRLRRQFGHLGPRAGHEEPTHSAHSSNWRTVRPRGRQSAPPMPMPSSSAYESLRSASNPNIRNKSSVPDMRHDMRHSSSQPLPRFAPRRNEQTAFGGWQPTMANVAEHPVLPTTASSTQGPPRRFAPPSTNEPSFGTRAAAVGFDESRRTVSDSATGQPRRRMFSPQGPADELGAPGISQFAPSTQLLAEFAPRSYPPTHSAPQTTPQFDSRPQPGRRTFSDSLYNSPSEPSRQGQEHGQGHRTFVQGLPQSYAEVALQPSSHFSPRQPDYAQTIASSRSPVNWTYELQDLGGNSSYPSGHGSSQMARPSDETQASRNAPLPPSTYLGRR